MQHGLVTTIIPVFNRAAMLREAVGSVLAQTYSPIEIVIVDDGSTDDTGAVADQLAREHPSIVRVIHQRNAGVGPAREAGRLTARGEFIQHLDSDDLLLPRKFELEVAALRAHPECGVAYGWTRIRTADGEIGERPERSTGEVIATMFPAMLRTRIWHTLTPLYRRSLIDAAGTWQALRNEEDWEYDARIAALGVQLAHVREWTSEFRHHQQERLSMRGAEPAFLKDRAKAHVLIYQHARRAGVGDSAPEMQRYARELFLLARQCGAAGLKDESRTLFELARDASGPRRNGPQFHAYRLLAGLFGWSRAGRLADLFDRVRP